MRKRLLRRIFPSYLLIAALSIIAVSWYASISLQEFFLGEPRADLEARALLIEPWVAEHLNPPAPAMIDRLCKQFGPSSKTRITVVLPGGEVVGDSEEDPDLMVNHSDRPEVKQALAGGIGSSRRMSHTLGHEMMYVALPVKNGDRIIGVVRTSIPLTLIGEALGGIYTRIMISGLIIAMVAAIISFIISRRISRLLEELKRGADRFASGDLRHRLMVTDSEEIGALAESMNEMAAQLEERMRALARQGAETEAILSSMVEGLIAVDAGERIITINRPAARMFHLEREQARGRSLQEAIRNADLHGFVKRALASPRGIEADIILGNGEERFLQVHGAMLMDAGKNPAGVVVVLNDITRIKRFENMRREFAANVSHELKTPITSIKGFVETLLDGAVSEPADARRFLEIVSRQVDRLNAIIEDLLLLSRIEQEEDRRTISFEPARVKGVIEAAVQGCGVKVAEKNVTIEVECPDDLAADMNAPLFEQALINLVDNAVKFSEPGGIVSISAAGDDGGLAISVRDRGPGIAPEFWSRIFERFYRVDKARSRKQGGTGLGLSIVKHIVAAHAGRVTVESAPGRGSTFTIIIPAFSSGRKDLSS